MSLNVRKRTFGHVRPAKIQINLRIRTVWSESSLATFLIAKDANRHVDHEDSYQTAQMSRLIWLFVGRIHQKVRFHVANEKFLFVDKVTLVDHFSPVDQDRHFCKKCRSMRRLIMNIMTSHQDLHCMLICSWFTIHDGQHFGRNRSVHMLRWKSLFQKPSIERVNDQYWPHWVFYNHGRIKIKFLSLMLYHGRQDFVGTLFILRRLCNTK